MASPSQLPPPGSPGAPLYWMDETSGVLAGAVKRFIANPRSCSLSDLTILRKYFQLWVDAPVWDMNPTHDDESRADLAQLRAQCRGITNIADMEAWLVRAVEKGLDPL